MSYLDIENNNMQYNTTHAQEGTSAADQVAIGMPATEAEEVFTAREPLELLPPSTEDAVAASGPTSDNCAIGTVESVKEMPTTKRGACMVCLTDSIEVLDASWLHAWGDEEDDTGYHAKAPSSSSQNRAIDECDVSACLACLKSYFEGMVDSGISGTCMRMRCMCCPRTVLEQSWGPLVDDLVLRTFRMRAFALVEIPCVYCDWRFNPGMIFSPDASYRDSVDKLAAELPSEATGEWHSETASPGSNRQRAAPASASAEAERASFLAALDCYASGGNLDVEEFYELAQRYLKIGVSNDPDDQMHRVLRCIPDSERRASLQLRFLRHFPIVESPCCYAIHCFWCRVAEEHPGVTCSDYQASRGFDDVLQCPSCGLHIVKGDGCTSVTCACGHELDWDQLIGEQNERRAQLFRAAYPENTGRAAAEIEYRAPFSEDVDASGAIDSSVVDKGKDRNDDRDGDDVGNDAGRISNANACLGGESGGDRMRENVEDVFREDTRGIGDRATDFGPKTATDGADAAQSVAEDDEDSDRPSHALTTGSQSGAGAHPGVKGREAVFDRPQTNVRPDVAALEVQVQYEPADEGWPASPRTPATTPISTLNLSPPQGGPPRAEMTAEEKILLAHAFGQEFPEDSLQGRLSLFVDLNPHYTIEIALFLKSVACTEDVPCGWPRDGLGRRGSGKNEAWQQSVANEWITLNAPAAQKVQRQLDTAHSALVEALYGERGAIALTVAGKGQEALIWALSDEEIDFVYRSESSSPAFTDAVCEFGSLRMTHHVCRWLSNTSRRSELERLMSEEDERLEQAWVGLWGWRTMCNLVWSVERQARAVATAARRCVLLQDFPDLACREQAPMMKAFLRRNPAAVEYARAEIIKERASAWEKIYCYEFGCDKSPRKRSSYTSFDIAYDACERFTRGRYATEWETWQQDSPLVPSHSLLEQQRIILSAAAWKQDNHDRINACRFENLHRTGAACAAALLLVVMPRVFESTFSVCSCYMSGVHRQATAWSIVNEAEFKDAVESMEAQLAAGQRISECACDYGHEAVCPERVRKILGVPPRSSCRRHDCSVMMEDANYLGLLFDESESTPP